MSASFGSTVALLGEGVARMPERVTCREDSPWAGVGAVTGGSAINRTSIVSIRSSSASLGGGKTVSDLEWRRADLATWNPMTTADAMVESRTIRKNGLNDPWSNSVFLQMRLSWTSDAPATYSTGLVFTLTITTP